MKRALVCEDDPAIRTLVRTIMKREGFDVDEAENGTEGLKKINEGCYDILVLDLMMPEMSGYDVVQNLRPEQVKRVIIMTAVATLVALAAAVALVAGSLLAVRRRPSSTRLRHAPTKACPTSATRCTTAT